MSTCTTSAPVVIFFKYSIRKKKIAAILCVVLSLAASAQKKIIKTETFTVFGTCEQCKNRIEKTLAVSGMYTANWVVETNMLTVSYDSLKFTKSSIQQRLALVGHDTEEFQSDSATYESLPLCCHYKRYLKPGIPSSTDSIRTKQEEKTPKLFTITGVVLEEDKKGKILPLAGATVRCTGTNQEIVTNNSGVFQLSCTIPSYLIVSYVGFRSDTLPVTSPSEIKVILKNASYTGLKEVLVEGRGPSTFVSSISTFNTLNIGSRELAKAACCNLSESFETSPSIDVSYADAVTGIKQIQLLGLTGNYTQLLTENTPEIRGLTRSYGLTFIPGPWIEGIQVTKGTGSVVNGYESIAGQINIEEKKPDKAEKLFLNSYVNIFGRLESSINFSKTINDSWSTLLLTHVNGVVAKIDDNKDRFLDIPLGRQFNIINRWKYSDIKGVIAQFSIKALNDYRQAGEIDFNPSTDKLTTNKYGVSIDVQQYVATGKLGYVFPQQKYKSIGLIVSAVYDKNNSYYGLTKYYSKQNSVYATIIYQSIIGSTAHKFRTGLSFVNENFNEMVNMAGYKRNETVPGTFFEYTYTAGKKFTAIAGFRFDYHNQYNLITTPRLHLKYDFAPKTNLRFSIGSGMRVANIFAENSGVFVSARQYTIVNQTNNFGYGLDPEKAWNYGFNFIHSFMMNNQPGSFSVDVYRTQFKNQTVVDVDNNPQKIIFYNLAGKSFSNTIQAELNYEPVKKLELRLAYRWLDVKTDYTEALLEKPLISKHRAFINIAYETNNRWKFDYTTQWLSKKRLPNTGSNPPDKQLGTYSPSFIQMSGQLTKKIGNKWELYVGAENITDYTQKKLIIEASNPFSQYFDGSITWGPVNGRIIYAGFRYRVKYH